MQPRIRISAESKVLIRPALRPVGQAGQALLETLIFVAAAGVFLICMLAIGRLNSIQASAIGAARSIAFECRIPGTGCDDSQNFNSLAASLRTRHFSGPAERNSPNSTDGRALPGVPRTDPFWSNPDGQPMIQSSDSIAVSSTSRRLDAGANVAASVASASSLLDPLMATTAPGRFGFDARAGFRVASIESPAEVLLPLTASPTKTLAIRIRARLAILGDEWNASQTLGDVPDSVQSRVLRGSRLDDFREAALEAGYAITKATLGVADSLGLEPGAANLRSHVLDVGIVPGDRRP